MYHFASALHRMIARYSDNHHLNCTVRIGIATGPLTAGIIGKNRTYFDVWGETVNLAACLEQNAAREYIAVCPVTAKHLPAHLVAAESSLASSKHPDTNIYYQLIIA